MRKTELEEWTWRILKVWSLVHKTALCWVEVAASLDFVLIDFNSKLSSYVSTGISESVGASEGTWEGFQPISVPTTLGAIRVIEFFVVHD